MTTLRFVGRPFEGFERALERQMDAFEAQSDRDVSFERDHRPLPDIHHELIEDRGLEDGQYDLLLCLSDWLPAVAAAGMLQPLGEYIQESPPPNWPEGWAESMRTLASWEGNVYGIPYHDGPELLHYREDLFENSAEQREFRREYGRPLQPPKTWREFVNVAEFFTRPDEELWGSVVAAKPDGHNNVYDFLIQLWSRGGQVLDGTRPAFDSPEGVEALRFYHDLIHEHEVVPPESVEMESVESGQFYADGHAAMMWNWAGFGALAEEPGSAVFGRTNYGLIPRADGPGGTHTSLTVMYSLTIPSSSNHRALAYEFLRFAGGPEMDKVTTVEGASGTRFTTWRDPEVLRANTFYSMVEEVNTGGVNMLPRIPEYTELNEILNQMVRTAVVDRNKSPAEAIEAAASETRALFR